MDQERFDRLAVTLAHGPNRRTLLRVFSGAVLSVGVLGAADVAGKGTRRKRRAKAEACPPCPACKRCNAQGRCVADRGTNGQCCPRGSDRTGACFEGHCLPAGTCEEPACPGGACPEGFVCQGNVCTCPLQCMPPCACVVTTEGAVCSTSGLAVSCTACTSSSECPVNAPTCVYRYQVCPGFVCGQVPICQTSEPGTGTR
jgi:hypothetical protein